jgi:CheY-like chemotaxis protein
LEMALFNLAANARDAMPEGGALRISANVRSPADDELEGCARIPYVVITMADTGCGMDKDTLARAIEPFFSTKGIGKGTGLGLSMVHGLVAQLGGALTLKSETGAGTSVDLWLPTTEIQIIENPRPENPGPFNASGVVLLVDDEPLVRITTGDMLAGLGYSVIDAGNAQDALNLIEAGLRPRFLITDHLMPDMTGAELAMKVKASHPEIRILIITGYAEQKALPAGVPSLRKPFLQAELVTRLQALSQEPAPGDDKT